LEKPEPSDILVCYNIGNMSTHQLQLATVPFNAIVSGTKTIESRLYDEKRQLIKIGDSIEFTNRETPDQRVSVKVIGLLRYETFHDLFSHNEPTKFGGESIEWLENQINEFYSIDDQRANGVIGIEFDLL
jgi:ASC-1-like (ASCH) protein